jgi:hypothetical protein
MNGNIFEIFFRTFHIQPKVSAIKVQSHLIFFFNDGEYFLLLGGILFIILISYLTSYFIFTVGQIYLYKIQFYSFFNFFIQMSMFAALHQFPFGMLIVFIVRFLFNIRF